VFVKELGLGVAFAVILDATVVRGVLVPALMKLLGPASWWSPAWLRRVGRPVSTPTLPKQPLAPGAVLSADRPAVK
jgi:RND superfamily putative drug exporter